MVYTQTSNTVYKKVKLFKYKMNLHPFNIKKEMVTKEAILSFYKFISTENIVNIMYI